MTAEWYLGDPLALPYVGSLPMAVTDRDATPWVIRADSSGYLYAERWMVRRDPGGQAFTLSEHRDVMSLNYPLRLVTNGDLFREVIATVEGEP